MAEAETLDQRKAGVRHVLDDHEDHQAELRVIAKHLGITWEVFRQEIIDEVAVVVRPART